MKTFLEMQAEALQLTPAAQEAGLRRLTEHNDFPCLLALINGLREDSIGKAIDGAHITNHGMLGMAAGCLTVLEELIARLDMAVEPPPSDKEEPAPEQ